MLALGYGLIDGYLVAYGGRAVGAKSILTLDTGPGRSSNHFVVLLSNKGCDTVNRAMNKRHIAPVKTVVGYA